MPEKELNIGEDNVESELRLTPKGREIIGLFQRATNETDEQKQEKLFQEFYLRLNEAVTPIGSEPYVNEMLHEIKRIALGKGTDRRLYIGSGTSGQRISFQDFIALKKDDSDSIKRLAKGAKIVRVDNDWVEAESVNGKPRWMRYPRPDVADWGLGKDYWECYMKTFGEEIVDLLQELR